MSHFYDGWDEANVDGLLRQFGIDPELCVQDSSTSTRIKLALISAAGHNPFLLLLDNPLMQVDARARNEISQFLKSLASKRGTAIVVSAQHSSDLLGLSDSTLTLVNGKMGDEHSGNRANAGL